MNNVKKPRLKDKAMGLITRVGAWCAAFALIACNTQKFDQPPEQQGFGQKVTYNNEVDVLFVIDTSTPSMGNHQKALAAEMQSVINAFDSTGLDYHIAITSMDMSANGERGRFIVQTGTPSILTKQTSNLVPILADRLFLGVYDWNPLTRGLEAMKAALSGTNVTSGPNAGFLRKNALLNVIFLTTVDDRSASLNYKAWLDQIRPPLAYGDRSWVAQFLGVTADDPSCKSTTWQYNQPGYTYIDLAKYSGGAVESICDGNWKRAVTNVRSRILEMITEYFFDGEPVPESIKVRINGQSIANDPVNGWTYLKDRRSLRFHGSAIPPVDSYVDVQYDRVGLK